MNRISLGCLSIPLVVVACNIQLDGAVTPADAGAPADGPDGSVADASTVIDGGADAAPPVDWALRFDVAHPIAPLSPALIGQYDLSGALFRYDRLDPLIGLMRTAGFSEWRVGLGRWEGLTQLFPTLTDGTSCASALAALPAEAFAPPGTTDLDLVRARDWFTWTDGAPVTPEMTTDDERYRLDYIRSVLDVVDRFGADAYVDIDHMPRALAANQTPTRTFGEWADACGWSWTNDVSNVRPADVDVFASAVRGLVKRLVEGSGGERGRPVRYFELWNEPELPYAWNPHVGSMDAYFLTAAKALGELDAYRKATSNRDGQAIRIGLGSFADYRTAAAVLSAFPGTFDFVSFHLESSDDPLEMVAAIAAVADARKASRHPDAELFLTEWGYKIAGSKLDPTTMDVALHHATLLALGATAGVTHAHHALFWDFYDVADYPYAFIHHDFTPKPAYYVFPLFARLIRGPGAARLEAAGAVDGKLEGGVGAALAAKGGDGVVRVLLVNRGDEARTATVGAAPSAVIVFDDPHRPPRAVVSGDVVTIPPRSIVLVER